MVVLTDGRLSTQRRHTCRSKADAQISRKVRVEWTIRPPFAVIQVSRVREIPANGKRTLSTLWSWYGSRNALHSGTPALRSPAMKCVRISSIQTG